MTFLVTTISLLAVATAALVVSIKHIPEGQVYTLHRRHRDKPQLLRPGTHWIVPLRDRVAHKISLAGRTLHVDAPLDDGHGLHATVYWQVLDPEPADAVIDEADALIRAELQQRATASDAPGSADLKTSLNLALRGCGLLVTRVDVAVRAAMPAAA